MRWDGGNPGVVRWGAGKAWAQWEARAGGETEAQRRSKRKTKRASAVLGAETSCAGAAACCLLEEGQTCQKRRRLGIGDAMGGFKQAESEGQARRLGGRWGRAWRIGPNGPGWAGMRQKTQNFAVSCLWNSLNEPKRNIWIAKSERMTV